MICFEDKTFCTSPKCVNTCGRKLTPEIMKQAQKWWNDTKGEGGVPIVAAHFCDEVDGNK